MVKPNQAHRVAWIIGQISQVPQPRKRLTDQLIIPLPVWVTPKTTRSSSLSISLCLVVGCACLLSTMQEQGVAQLSIPLCGVVGFACLFSTMQGPPLSMLGWAHHPCDQLTSTSRGLSSQCVSRRFLNVFTVPLLTTS